MGCLLLSVLFVDDDGFLDCMYRSFTSSLLRPISRRPRVSDLLGPCTRAAAFSRCGNVFFLLRQLFGLQSWTFSAAGFFPASAGFFLASDGFFPASDGFFPLPPKCIFSAAKVLLCCCKVFFCCFEFLPLRSGIFCWRFFPLRKQLFPAARRFFPAAKRVFFRSDVFFLLRTCIFRALREDKELENVESYTGHSPLVSWIAHGQVGEEGEQTLKQPSANEKLKRTAVDAATCFNGIVDTSENGKKKKKKQKNDNNHKNNNNNKNKNKNKNNHHHRHLHHYNLQHHHH